MPMADVGGARPQEAWRREVVGESSASGQRARDSFDLPPLDAFPTLGDELSPADEFEPFPDSAYEQEGEELEEAGSVHSDEFVDAETFMANHKPGEDSFLREAAGGDIAAEWSDADDVVESSDVRNQRPSDIFVPKSRNMDKVEFSSPERKQRQKSISVHHTPPVKNKRRASQSNGMSTPAFSASTALSSERDIDIHVDSRLILTPNSLKYLQTQERNRLPNGNFSLSNSKASSSSSTRESHSVHAQHLVSARTSALAKVPDMRSINRPSSAEKAMHAGPKVIRKALHELESMLQTPGSESDDSDTDAALEKLKSRLLAPPVSVNVYDHTVGAQVQNDNSLEGSTNHGQSQYSRLRTRSDASQAIIVSRCETGVQTDATLEMKSEEKGEVTRRLSSHKSRLSGNESGHFQDRALSSKLEEKSSQRPPESSEPWQHLSVSGLPTPSVTVKMKHDFVETIPSEGEDKTPIKSVDVFRETPFRPRPSQQSHNRQAESAVGEYVDRGAPSAKVKSKAVGLSSERRGEISTSDKNNDSNLPLATATPSQMARRCRRFLCSVGESMSEQIIFSNGSNSVGRICVSLLPLSTGCQQFSVTPAVLELQPNSNNAFKVTFDAINPGVVAGIFQFRAVGVDSLYDPYEVLIEASVRGDLRIPSQSAIKRKSPARLPPRPRAVTANNTAENQVTELPSQLLAGVQISPTFLRFQTTVEGERNGETKTLRISNTTSEHLKFQLKSSHEHLQLTSSRGDLLAGTTVEIEVSTLCRPFGRDSPREDWCGSVTVIVGDVLSREISVVIDRYALEALPRFDEVARSRQAISTQTDSFYYTKKVNRRGLYFHARAVECGSCLVGESHQVPVYICNGSDSPMTVFLQALQEPFSCLYQPTTLQARKFIEVPITFRPKAPGKVATCLVAYTVNGKAAVTLIARGVDKPETNALLTE